MESRVPVLIVAKPKWRQDGLGALLRAIPGLEIMRPVDNGPAALEVSPDYPPSLVLLDSNLPDDEVWTVLEQTGVKWPYARSLVLVDNIQQQGLAKAAGADQILLSGFSTEMFFAAGQGVGYLEQGNPGYGFQPGP